MKRLRFSLRTFILAKLLAAALLGLCLQEFRHWQMLRAVDIHKDEDIHSFELAEIGMHFGCPESLLGKPPKPLPDWYLANCAREAGKVLARYEKRLARYYRVKKYQHYDIEANDLHAAISEDIPRYVKPEVHLAEAGNNVCAYHLAEIIER